MILRTIMRYLLLIILITAILAQTTSRAADVTDIHTPDFPEYLNSTNLQNTTLDYTKYLQLLMKLLSSANKSGLLSELVSNETIRKYLNDLINMMKTSGDLKNMHQVETLLNHSSLSVNELLQSIENERLAELLREAFISGLVNEELLKIIEEMYVSGEISFDDYVRALHALQKISELSGNEELAKRIDSLLLTQLMNSLTDSALRLLENPATLDYLLREGLSKEVLENMLQFLSNSPERSEEVLRTLRSLLGSESLFSAPSIPSFRFPSPGMFALVPNLAVDPNTLAILALSVTGFILTLILLFLKRREISVIISQVTQSISRRTYHFNSAVVNIYWSSVDLLSRWVQRSSNETHREYLNKVCSVMPEVGRLFRDITEAYEKVRWGAQDENTFIEKVAREFNELRRMVSGV
ncbi:MAG: DUF4129 domain-containing protein [Desulfurococcaceae archaeon TW002]